MHAAQASAVTALGTLDNSIIVHPSRMGCDRIFGLLMFRAAPPHVRRKVPQKTRIAPGNTRLHQQFLRGDLPHQLDAETALKVSWYFSVRDLDFPWEGRARPDPLPAGPKRGVDLAQRTRNVGPEVL